MNDIKKYINNNSSRIIITTIALIVIALVVLYSVGYRIGSYGIAKVYKLKINNIPAESEVFVNNLSHGFKEGDIAIDLAPGAHSVIVSKVGFWPYFENVRVEKNASGNLSIHPFLVPQDIVSTTTTPTNPAYKEINQLFLNKELPSEEKKLTSASGLVSLYIKDGGVFASWEGEESEAPAAFYTSGEYKKEVEVFRPYTPIKNISFLKDRDDALIIAIADGVFALELNPTQVQNLQPIFEGGSPDFRISSEGNLYVKDENTLMKLEF